MPSSENGFSVLAPSSKDLVNIVVGGKTFKVRRSCRDLFTKLLTFLNTVEPFSEAGWDGGYAYRTIAGSHQKWSNHSSGTAIDMNASQHAQGTKNIGWTSAQIKIINWYLANTAAGRAIRWGNDYTTTPDSMHFEVKSPAAGALYNRIMSAASKVD